MDTRKLPEDEAEFDGFIEPEKARGTSFVNVVGGEPNLVLGRLKKIYNNFSMAIATNSVRRIPLEGFENMPVLISRGATAQIRATLDSKMSAGEAEDYESNLAIVRTT